MKVAVSTACFYPEDTFSALRALVKAGVKDVEVFFNTDSEISTEGIEIIQDIISTSSVNICAIHPFYSAFEWFYFFSGYKGRVEDGIRLYRKVFEVANLLNVPIVTFHGEHKNSTLDRHDGYKILKQLFDVASEYGVTLCQENVTRNKISTPEEIYSVRKFFNDDIAFTIDMKQARRSGYSPLEMVEAAGSCLRHVHISSANVENDCVSPNTTDPEVEKVIAYLNNIGYNGYMVIELYRNGFNSIQDLKLSYDNIFQSLK